MKKNAFSRFFLGICLSFLLITPMQTVLAGPLDPANQEGFGQGGAIPQAFDQGPTPKTPAQILISILNLILTFIGLILVSFLIYAGFMWMMSAGDSGKVEKAMGIIKTCIIGLVILLSAWIITHFVVERLSGATTGSGSSHNVRIINSNP